MNKERNYHGLTPVKHEDVKPEWNECSNNPQTRFVNRSAGTPLQQLQKKVRKSIPFVRAWDPEWEKYQERAVDKGYVRIEDTDLMMDKDGKYRRKLMEDHASVSKKFPGADANFVKNY